MAAQLVEMSIEVGTFLLRASFELKSKVCSGAFWYFSSSKNWHQRMSVVELCSGLKSLFIRIEFS